MCGKEQGNVIKELLQAQTKLAILALLQHIMLVNVKLDISGCNRITFHIFVNFLCSSTANAKLAILIFLYCGDFVKNPTLAKHRIILYLLALWM